MDFICNLCPRRCNAIRDEEHIPTGFCGCSSKTFVAAANLHFWEEPCISGKGGSGTVFFSSCNLRCVYCQNEDFSRKETGRECTPGDLAEIFLSLRDKGAENINLVTPTPHVYAIREAICEARSARNPLDIPVVYNSSGYEMPETLKTAISFSDVFLVDYKYFSPALSSSYSKAADYPEFASKTLEYLCTVFNGPPVFENGMLKKGVIVRHLVLPGCSKDSVDVLREIYRITGGKNVLLSLMSQYLPNSSPRLPANLKRKITTLEYERVLDAALSLGFGGYMQELSSASKGYVPQTGDIITHD